MTLRNRNLRSPRAARLVLAPITRAIRHSLFASAALVALSLPASALADNACGPGPTAVRCVASQLPANARNELVDDPSVVVGVKLPVAGFASLLPTDVESGIVVLDPYSATLDNADPVDVAASASGDAYAYGAIAGSDGFSYLTNETSGSINVTADSINGTALAVGVYAYAGVSASLWNYGDVSTQASSVSGDAQAYAAVVAGVPTGIGLLVNGGQLQATASSDSGEAHATGAYVVADVASIFNDADISATATTGSDGSAVARGAAISARYAAIYNYGDVVAAATGGLVANATGLDASGYYGVTIDNAGNLSVSAVADGSASAYGSSAIATAFGAYSTNSGHITAQAEGASAQVAGVINASLNLGEAITTNSGDIDVIATGGIAAYGSVEAAAQGIYNLAFAYDSIVYNTGAVSATALAMADISGTNGFLQAKAVGVAAVDVVGYGDARVDNGGNITSVAKTSQGYASAWGAAATSSGQYGGGIAIDNSGMISAYAYSDIGVARATAIYAKNNFGSVDIDNSGDISAVAHSQRGIPQVSVNYTYATGVQAFSLYAQADTSVANSGDIFAEAASYGAINQAFGINAYGRYTTISNAAGASINVYGNAEVFGAGFATGIQAKAQLGISVINAGDILARGDAHGLAEGAYTSYGSGGATGIYAGAGYQGNVYVGNTGTIHAIGHTEHGVTFFNAGAGATGIETFAKYDSTVVNGGDISAIADSDLGIVSAYGVRAHGKYSNNVINQAGASIVVSATSGSLYTDTYGGRAFTIGIHDFGSTHGYIYNAGSISAHAEVIADGGPNQGLAMAKASGVALGSYSHMDSGLLVNLGDIGASAEADFGTASAYGAYFHTQSSAELHNQGHLQASASAASGDAWSVGAYMYSLHKTLYVPCDAYGYCDWSQATYTTDGGLAAFANDGGVSAIAQADGGIAHAYGTVLLGAFGNSADNTGQIAAVAAGEDATAMGLLALSSAGATSVSNSGSITASATGETASATAVKLGALTTASLTNSGTIAAYGDGLRIAIDASGTGIAQLSNSGTMVGAVLTGAGDDQFDNASNGSWLALGASDFGAGDDSIVNHGSVILQNASVTMGGYVLANAFDNDGVMTVSGDSAIDMGGSFALTNNGTIDFIDGAANDSLAVTGVLGGSGTLRFDADLAAQAGDLLQVSGSVAGTAHQIIDVNVFGVPVSAHESIDLVTADGLAGGTFVLGTVHSSSDFLTEAFSLSHSAHAVTLGMDVTGLNDSGTLAVSAASAAVGMLNAQVGTFRQRLGVDPYGDPGKVMSAFFRTYTRQADVSPMHAASNFGQGGNFDYDLSTWGRELGVNANLFGNVHVGLTAGSAEGRQRLAGNGAGSNRMDGTTWGLYASWYDPQGLYVDISGRWMAVDVQSSTASGTLQTRAHTGAWSLEAGYQWQLGGWSVVPQLQYTRTRVEDIDPVQGSSATILGHGGSSRRVRLGVEASKHFDMVSGWRVTPYASIHWLRELDGEMAYTVAGHFNGVIGDAGSSAMAELGVGVQKGRWSVSAGATWLDGGAFQHSLGGQAVVRLTW